MCGLRRSQLLATALLLAGCGAAATPAIDPGDTGQTPGKAAPPATPAATTPVETDRALTAWPFEKFTHDGHKDAADPTNMGFAATPGQLEEAAKRAGWLHADPITTWSSFKMINAALRHKPYPTAPMSKLYLFDREQDISLQIPTHDVAVRDHFRLWATSLKDKLGRTIWIGAGTKDIAIKLDPGSNHASHEISPKIDEERQVIVDSFQKTGLVERTYQLPGIGQRYEGLNGSADHYWTDGMVAVIELKNFPAPELPKKKSGAGVSARQAGTEARVLPDSTAGTEARVLPDGTAARPTRAMAQVVL